MSTAAAEAPVQDLLATMTAASVEQSEFDPKVPNAGAPRGPLEEEEAARRRRVSPELTELVDPSVSNQEISGGAATRDGEATSTL